MQNDNYYPSIVDKLTHLIHSIIMFHPFVDGNKTTSIVVWEYFLRLNLYNNLSDFPNFLEDIVVDIAAWKTSKEQLKNILKDYINEIFN